MTQYLFHWNAREAVDTIKHFMLEVILNNIGAGSIERNIEALSDLIIPHAEFIITSKFHPAENNKWETLLLCAFLSSLAGIQKEFFCTALY